MSTWTHEDEEKLEEMLARKDAARFAQRKVALEIISLLSDDEGNPNAAWGPVQAKQIRELLAPYDEAPVMLGEFVPASAKVEPEVVPFPHHASTDARLQSYFDEREEPPRNDRLRRFHKHHKGGGTSYWFIFDSGDRSPMYDLDENRQTDIVAYLEDRPF